MCASSISPVKGQIVDDQSVKRDKPYVLILNFIRIIALLILCVTYGVINNAILCTIKHKEQEWIILYFAESVGLSMSCLSLIFIIICSIKKCYL